MDIFRFAGNYVLFDFTRLEISKIIKMLILASLESYPSYLQQTYMKLNFHSNYSVCLNNVSSSILVDLYFYMLTILYLLSLFVQDGRNLAYIHAVKSSTKCSGSQSGYPPHPPRLPFSDIYKTTSANSTSF